MLRTAIPGSPGLSFVFGRKVRNALHKDWDKIHKMSMVQMLPGDVSTAAFLETYIDSQREYSLGSS